MLEKTPEVQILMLYKIHMCKMSKIGKQGMFLIAK